MRKDLYEKFCALSEKFEALKDLIYGCEDDEEYDDSEEYDEYDDDEKENIIKIAENQYLVEGSMKIDDINDVLDTDMDSEDYDSIAGLMIEHLDRLPEIGECVTLENDIVLRVHETDQNRVTRVLVKLPDTPVSDETENIETA